MREIPLFKVAMHPSVGPAVTEVLQSGFVGQGPKVEEFEKLLKARLQYPHLVTLNNATAGLHLALRLINIQPGQEVITSANTCLASNCSIINNFAVPLWADIDPGTCNISLDSIVALATEKTKAILVVLWGGYPVRVDDLRQKLLAKGLNIPIIQDCAHAFGSYYKGQHVGTSGDTYSVFSFQAIKTLTTVDGAAILTPPEQYSRAKLLRWYGIDRENPNAQDFRAELDVREVGYKFHMNDVCATIGIQNLANVDGLIAIQKDNAAFYRRELANISGLQLLRQDPDCDSAHWLFTILVEKRQDFMKHMKAHGIVVSKVHERNDTHSALAPFKRHLPTLEYIAPKICNIPVGWWCKQEDREYIVETIRKGW